LLQTSTFASRVSNHPIKLTLAKVFLLQLRGILRFRRFCCAWDIGSGWEIGFCVSIVVVVVWCCP
jgi:hypothetical protein